MALGSSAGASSKPAEDMDLREFFWRIAPYRWWLLASTLMFTAIFSAAAFIKTPVYRVATVLVPVGIERTGSSVSSALGQLGGLASLAGLNIGSSNSSTEEALAVLRSREFTQQFIAENDLLPKLYFRKWNAVSKTWRVSPSKVPTLARAATYFAKAIRSIEQDKKTGLVTLNIDWRDAAVAAEWSQLLISRLNHEMRQRAHYPKTTLGACLGRRRRSATNDGTA